MQNNDDVNAQFAQLQRDYLVKLEVKSQTIATLWQQFRQTDAPEAFKALYRELHSVAGTSAVLGYDDVSQLARNAELLLIGKDAGLDDKEKQQLASHIEALDTLIHSGTVKAKTKILR